MSLLNPLVAAALNDIHYLLKAHVPSKERFRKLDRSILRMLIKVGVVAQEYEASVIEMTAVCRIEKLTKQFVLLFLAFSRCEKSLDVDALIDILQEMRQALLFLTERVFSEKSIKRVDFIFEELSYRDLWNSVFSPDVTAEQRQLLLNLTTSFDRVLASNLL
ncbi:Tumor necrosis factor [Sparganum proliferum]